MRRVALLLVLCFCYLPAVSAPTLRAVAAITDFWPEGESRIYNFTLDDSVEVGRIEVTLTNVEIKDGKVVSCEIDEDLYLNLRQFDKGADLKVRGLLTLDGSGNFLSTALDITVDENSQALAVSFDSVQNLITGFWGEDDSQGTKINVEGPIGIYDDYMIDHLEIALSRHNLIPGTDIKFKALAAQKMYVTDYEFKVLDKVAVNYPTYTDSVWPLAMIRPTARMVYINAAHKIVKLIDHNQKLTVEIIGLSSAPRTQSTTTATNSLDNIISRLPIYGFYFLITGVGLLLLGRDCLKDKTAYFMFLIGCLMYPLIFYIQLPLQQSYADTIAKPALYKGQSFALYAIIPALITGLIQQTLKLIPLILLVRFKRPQPLHLISIGAFVGAGLGMIDAWHIVGPLFQFRGLTTLTLAEKGFSILFHIAGGALIGYGIARRKTIRFWLTAVLIHGLAGYMIVFVQTQAFTAKGLTVANALYSLAFLAMMYYYQRAYRKAMTGVRKGKR